MTRVRVGHLAAAALAVLLPLGTAHAAADARKVVRDVFPVAETGFDPAAVTDLYSAGVIRANRCVSRSSARRCGRSWRGATTGRCYHGVSVSDGSAKR